ncbi:hypothetical protein [Agriterribacter sp.]|nr:hypothetical protein [Agriterribacter sp.]HRO46992.1 hypothetical protein [Agriterribacter sp.]HRQ18465.1 hypothetical protein [Agriterribacter sp.]
MILLSQGMITLSFAPGSSSKAFANSHETLALNEKFVTKKCPIWLSFRRV